MHMYASVHVGVYIFLIYNYIFFSLFFVFLNQNVIIKKLRTECLMAHTHRIYS